MDKAAEATGEEQKGAEELALPARLPLLFKLSMRNPSE